MPHIYYTHLTSAMLAHYYISSWIKDACVQKFQSQHEVVGGLFLSIFPMFWNFWQCKKILSEFLSEIFLFENKTALTEVLEHFYDENK